MLTCGQKGQEDDGQRRQLAGAAHLVEEGLHAVLRLCAACGAEGIRRALGWFHVRALTERKSKFLSSSGQQGKQQ